MEESPRQVANLDVKRREDQQEECQGGVSPLFLFTSESNSDSEQYSSGPNDSFGDRIRTPNGHLKPNSVKLMTNYFTRRNNSGKKSAIGEARSSQAYKKASQPKRKARRVNKNTERKLRSKAERLGQTVKERQASVILEQNKQQTAQLGIDSGDDQTSDSDCFFTPAGVADNRQETLFLHQLAKKLEMASQEQRRSENQTGVKSIELTSEEQADIRSDFAPLNQMNTDTQLNTMEVESNERDNPEVMGVQTVAQILADLKKEMRDGMAEMKKDLNELKNKEVGQVSQEIIEKCREDITQMMDLNREQDRQEINKLKDDLKYFKYRNRTLTNVVDNMAVQINDLKGRLENVELNGCRNAVTLTGLYLQGNKSESIAKIENFIDQHIGVSVIVEDYFRVGAYEPKMTVIYFQTAQQKRDVLHFKAYLKNIENEDGKSMFINDYVPAAIQERRKRDRDIFSINESLQKPLDVKYSKGKLTIQGEQYIQKVKPPSPKELVDLAPDEIDDILARKWDQGGKILQDNSIFEGYSACVNSLKDVRKLYVKAKLVQPAARHIVCAYWIKGEGQPFYNQDFCDDEEPAAGRAVLNVLINNNMENRAVFIARKFGGIKMGSSRFECYQQAAKSAIGMCSWNPFTQTHQRIKLIPDGPSMNAQTFPKDAASAPVAEADSITAGNKRAATSPPIDENRRGALTSKKFNRGSYGNKYSGRGNRYRGHDYHQQALNSLRGTFQYKRVASRSEGWSRGQNNRSWSRRENDDSVV